MPRGSPLAWQGSPGSDWWLVPVPYPPGIPVPGSHPGLGGGPRRWRVSQETPGGVQVGGVGAGVGEAFLTASTAIGLLAWGRVVQALMAPGRGCGVAQGQQRA